MFDSLFLVMLARDEAALQRWSEFDIDAILFPPNHVGFRYVREFLVFARRYVLDGEIDQDALRQMSIERDSAEEVVPEFIADYSHHIYLNEPLVDALVAVHQNDHTLPGSHV